MGKIWLEVSLISARALRRSSLWKVQWFAVGWIDPRNKYCTRIDATGSSNPQWNTKFATLIDNSGSGFGDLTLHIEVYSREPVFLRESLHGAATILLKEFLLKHSKEESVSRQAIEEVGSYQLWKGNSNKPHGFVDISVRISEEGEVPSSYSGNGGGIVLMDRNNQINSAKGEDSSAISPQAPTTHLPIIRRARENPLNRTRAEFPHGPADRSNTSHSSGGLTHLPLGGQLPSYRPAQTPPPPAPPSNVGFVPTFLPRNEDPNTVGDYINMPPSGATPGQSKRPTGFDMGLGAGALAAGALIFGDDFMSGFDVPTSLQDASVSVSMDPPF